MSRTVGIAPLPDYFGHREGVAALGARGLRVELDAGRIIRLSRGVYRKSDAVGDDNLAEIGLLSSTATLCLTSALAHHDLTDAIPASIDIAIPRGTWAPATNAPVTWHRFDPATFTIGRTDLAVTSELSIGLYNAERSIVDAFRLAHTEGSEQAIDALKRWLRRGGQPSLLLNTAANFPKVLPKLRAALEVLL